MSSNPSTTFFFKDWETDKSLSLCSLAAQGLWMRMLCIAAAHNPMGYVAIGGRPLKTREIARLVGLSEIDLMTLLDELKSNEVFSVDRAGRIYNRRMVKGNKSRENGKMANNISHRKQKEKVNQGGLDSCGKGLRDLGIGSLRKKESEKNELILDGGASNDAWSNGGFDEFWEQYPNKVGKASASKAFDKIGRANIVTFSVMMAGLNIYVHKTDDRPWCNPATWLNQHRWLDKPAQVEQKNGQGRSRSFQDDSLSISKAAGRLAEKAERGEFTFGPRPRLFGALPAKDADDVQLLPPRRGA